MEHFDLIIMLVGAILLLVGLLMFVSGKRHQASHSQVEGFGVKLNISNPSVLLIVFGAGMMLFPRLFPANPAVNQHPSEANDEGITAQGAKVPSTAEKARDNRQDEPAQFEQSLPDMTELPQQDEQPTVFMPQGSWQMVDYAENGIDLSSNVSAQIVFSNQSPTLSQWQTSYQVADIWGNLSYIQYTGNIIYTNGSYSLQILHSNDPAFIGQNTVPLEIRVESGNRLHMEFILNGSQTLSHWVQ